MVRNRRTVARSQIVERFLEWGFPQFKQEALREGANYLYRLRYDFLALPPSRPDWLTADTSAAKPCLFMLSWRSWRRLVNAIAESEQAGAYLSISDLFMLYFAWGWRRFQRFAVGENAEQEQAAVIV
jgi:hypothetical protein